MTGNRILVTGGAGFVGSHACKVLAQAGHVPVVFDDLRRGNRWAVRWGPFVQASLEDREALLAAMREHRIDAVMHFAAYAYVSESVKHPSDYFRNNVSNSINLLDAMVEAGLSRLVISSTCATYGIPENLPISETTPQKPINPYGQSKKMLEEIAHWYDKCHGIRSVSLRYFNAAGCDPDGEIGEWHEPETHLIPLVVESALGTGGPIRIFGTDYNTPDGTAVRDYIHVMDLARAHIAAVDYLLKDGRTVALNLGTGIGTSVREIIEAIANASGRRPTVIEGPRRPGDPPQLVADPTMATEALGWRALRSDIATIAADTVRWYREIAPLINVA